MSVMRNLMVSAASMLYLLCWTAQSDSELQQLEARPGAEVTVLCPNYTSVPTQILWFRAVRRSKIHQISSIFNSDQPALTSSEFQDKFDTTSDVSTIFLKIKRVNLTDSGFYFCGFFMGKNQVIMSAAYLEVKGESVKTIELVYVLLGVLNVFLIVALVGLGIAIKRLHTALAKENNQKEGGGAEVNYATVAFKKKKSHRGASVRDEDLSCVYSTTK